MDQSSDAKLQELIELREKLKYSNAQSSLLEKLANSLDVKSAMDAVLAAFEELVPFQTVSYVIASTEGLEFSKLIYVFSRRTIGRLELSAIKQDMLSFVNSLPGDVENKNILAYQLEQKMYHEFIQGTLAEESVLQPSKNYIIPIQMRSSSSSSSTILGLFRVAFLEDHHGLADMEKYEKTSFDIARAACLHIERLHWLVQSQHAQLFDFVKELTNGALMFDMHKKVIISNPIITRLTGLPEAGFFLDEIIKLFEGKSKGLENLDKKIDNVLDSGGTLHIEEFPFLMFYYEMFITPIHGQNKNIIGGAIIMHDVTHMKEVDHLKTEFLSMASHELRTPLTAIDGIISMILDGDYGEISENLREPLKDVSDSSERLIHLVNDLLNISRIEAGRLKYGLAEFSAFEISKSMVAVMQPISEKKNITLELKDFEDKKVQGDLDKAEQILINLTGNALKFTDKGHVTLSAKAVGDKLEIAVTDTGIGITKENEDKLFGKFNQIERSEDRPPGTGLGLFLSRQMARKMGGDIWIEKSEKGVGSTFIFSIPLSGSEAARSAKENIAK